MSEDLYPPQMPTEQWSPYPLALPFPLLPHTAAHVTSVHVMLASAGNRILSLASTLAGMTVLHPGTVQPPLTPCTDMEDRHHVRPRAFKSSSSSSSTPPRKLLGLIRAKLSKQPPTLEEADPGRHESAAYAAPPFRQV